MPPLAMSAVDLDDDQQQVWEAFISGKNVGIFGRAGSGKSTVMGRAIARARKVHGVAEVGVMAWTTSAAKIIGGCTFHKFLGIKVEERPKEVILQKVRGNPFVCNKLRKTKVIFIDEVPQFAARWFTVFEYVMRQLAPVYKHALPWGGIQIIGTFSSDTEVRDSNYGLPVCDYGLVAYPFELVLHIERVWCSDSLTAFIMS